MAQKDVDTLIRARENFVRKRREMAEQMVPSGAAAGHFAPAFSELQAVIEALDRAIEDEGNLPETYAELPTREAAPGESNVERVNFELK
jgi:hypothetical protein